MALTTCILLRLLFEVHPSGIVNKHVGIHVAAAERFGSITIGVTAGLFILATLATLYRPGRLIYTLGMSEDAHNYFPVSRSTSIPGFWEWYKIAGWLELSTRSISVPSALIAASVVLANVFDVKPRLSLKLPESALNAWWGKDKISGINNGLMDSDDEASLAG